MIGFFYRQLAKASGNGTVQPGQKVSIKVDLALAHDGSGPEILRILKQDKQSIAAQSRVLITLDHCFPAPTLQDREFQREMLEFARLNHVIFYKNGEGVLHQVVAEEESLWPGMIIVGADGHVATSGAFGALAFSVTPSPFVEVISNGFYQLEVPEQLVVAIDGQPKSQVMARDIAMYLMNEHGLAIGGKAVVLTGSTVEAMNISEKMSLCNLMPEAGAVTALVLPQGEQEQVDLRMDAREIKPMIAWPGNPPKFGRVRSCAGQSISVAVAGGCSSGRLDDMKVIAEVLDKNEVHQDVTFIITPGSRSVMSSMDKMEISSILRNSGAVVMPPGCGPCPGKHLGVLSNTDVAITTTTRNGPGRMGGRGARIYLASPLTVALSAVHGVISEPAETV
jgi:3-isopropylmalate/(R)-2-methylmalate dehydratase large subunit